jgi:hypothetical protein
VDREAWHALRPALGLAWAICALSLLGPGGVGVGTERAADSLVAGPALRRDASRALLLRLLLELLHLLHQALLQNLVQQGMLLHDLARQQRMLQGLLQQRMLLDQLGRGLRVLQGRLHDRMRLEELLRQGRLLQDGLQQRVLLELAALLLALDVGAEGLRASGEAASATTKALRLELLRSGSLLFELRHVRLLVVE